MSQFGSETSDAPLQINTSDHTILRAHPNTLAHMNAIDIMTAKAPTENTWFTLPFDIRDEIYNILLIEGNLEILRASKDIYEEARRNIFKLGRLRLNYGCGHSITSTHVVPEIAEKIRKVELHINVGSEVTQEALCAFATSLNLLARSGGSTKTCDVILEIASRNCNSLHWFRLEEMFCQDSPAGPNEGEHCQIITSLQSFELVTLKVIHKLESGISKYIIKKRIHLGARCARKILGSYLGNSAFSGKHGDYRLEFHPLECPRPSGRIESSGIIHAIGLSIARGGNINPSMLW